MFFLDVKFELHFSRLCSSDSELDRRHCTLAMVHIRYVWRLKRELAYSIKQPVRAKKEVAQYMSITGLEPTLHIVPGLETRISSEGFPHL
jgi:hypothetical protein